MQDMNPLSRVLLASVFSAAGATGLLFGIDAVVKNYQATTLAERIARDEEKYLGELRKQTSLFRASYKFSVLNEKYRQADNKFEQDLILREMKAAVVEGMKKEDQLWAYETLFNRGWQEKLQVDAETVKEIGRKAIEVSKAYAPSEEREAIEKIFSSYGDKTKSVQREFDNKYWNEHPESRYEWMGQPQNREPRPEEIVRFTSIEERRRTRGYERPNYPEEQAIYDDSFKKLGVALEEAKQNVKNELDRKISEIERNTGAKDEAHRPN